MENMTMQQELEMLRAEVEILRQDKEKEVAEQQESGEQEQSSSRRAVDLREKAEMIEEEARDQLQELLATLKKDYEDISPVTAVLLFALGVAFGRSISK